MALLLSKITLPNGQSYDIRDNAAGHFLGTTTTDVTASTAPTEVLIGSTNVTVRDQDIVLYEGLLYIALKPSTTVTWQALTHAAPEADVTDVQVDGTTIITGTVANLDTTGETSGTGATAPYATSTNPVATKAYVDSNDTIKGVSIDSTALTADSNKIVNVATTGNYDGDSSTPGTYNPLATKNYVDTAVAELPQAMIFRGTIGSSGATIPNLPAVSSDVVGDVYQVIEDGKYGPEGSKIAAKVGDLFVCAQGGTAQSPTYSWVLIPSGNEHDGTVTSVATSNKGIITDQTSSGPITTSGTISLALKSENDNFGGDAVNVDTTATEKIYPVALDSSDKLAVAVPWTDTTYTFDPSHAYDASSNVAATVGTVTGAISNITAGTATGTAGAGATITDVTQTNGSVSVTYTPIAIASSQVTTMGSYDKDAAGATGAIDPADTLNVAVAKLENALDGKQATLTFDGTYNADTNKAATESTVNDAISEAISSTTATINGVTATSGDVVTGLEASTTAGTGAIQIVEYANETLTIKYLNPSTTAITQTTNVLQKPDTT